MELDEKILNSAVDLFFAKGIKSVSMDDVARSVGISKRTLYEHYDSKDALLVACINEMLSKRTTELYNMTDGSISFIEFIIRSVYDTISFAQNVTPQFFADLEKFNYTVVKDSVMRGFEELRQRTEALIEKGKADGLLRKEVDAKLVSYVIVDGDKGKLRACVGKCGWSSSYVFKQMCSIFIRGMATEKGIKLLDECLEKLSKQ